MNKPLKGSMSRVEVDHNLCFFMGTPVVK